MTSAVFRPEGNAIPIPTKTTRAEDHDRLPLAAESGPAHSQNRSGDFVGSPTSKKRTTRRSFSIAVKNGWLRAAYAVRVYRNSGNLSMQRSMGGVYLFRLKTRGGISRILSPARIVVEGMAGIRAISSSLIALPFHERIQPGDKTTKNVEA
jgi:hypothetical protein